MDQIFPTGAEALLIALQTPAPQGHIGIPVLLWGRPGIGKSSFLEQLSQADFPVLTLIAAIHDPTDFSGLPVFQNGQVHYARPEWVGTFEETGEGILFLDELTTAPPSVQAALLRVILERRVGFHALSKGVRVVAAANPPDMMNGGWELSPPLRNRFVHLHWGLPAETFLQGFTNGFPVGELPHIDLAAHAKCLPTWKLRIAAFLKRMPEALHGPLDDGDYAFASPRSWDFLAHLLASCDCLGQAPAIGISPSVACIELVNGCIGSGLAIPFLTFLNELRLPDPISVLSGQQALKLTSFNDSEVYVFFTEAAKTLLNIEHKEHLLAYSKRYLELAHKAFQTGRLDMVYQSLKQLSNHGFFTHCLALTQTPAEETEMKALINAILADTDLQQYLNTAN